MKKATYLIFTLMALAAMAVRAETSLKLADDITLRLGADFRLRYEGFSMSTVLPEAPRRNLHNNEYFRMRTRLKSAIDFGSDITVNFSLANRFHYVTTSPARSNNDGSGTWEFPDEVYIDSANIVFRNLVDGALTLTIGRQDLILGNGMILIEGTPYDQGRSIYNDGLVAKFKTEQDELTFFLFYNRWKDGTVFINDKNRRLRSGNVFTAGLYETHTFDKALSLDAYYMFNDQDDCHPRSMDDIERAHRLNESVSLHTVGARVFGAPMELIDYSLEGAFQFGRGARGEHLGGNMADARLNFHLAEDTVAKPVLGFEFTHFSGDKEGEGRYRGWNPLMSQCPLWGEELLPVMLNSVWSNLNMMRANLTSHLTEKASVSLYATDCLADEHSGVVGGNLPTGGGRHVGLLTGICGTYTFNEMFSAQAYYSYFMPGNYFANGHNSKWFRLELTASF